MEAVALLGAAVLALALLLVVLPLRIALRFGTDPWRFDLSVAPFAGLLGWVRLPRRAKPPSARPRPRGPRAAPPAPVLRALPGFLAALVERTRIDRLRLDLRFGTGDPALTGQVYGWMMPLVHGVGSISASDLRLRPDFDRTCLAGEAEVVLRLTPLRLAVPLFRLFLATRDRSA